MTIQLPLSQMTLAEKLEVMEALWDDLSRRPEELPSPEWHKELLEERRRLANEGKLKFLDWQTAFTQLKNEAHGDSRS
ncbi:MAG: addiction module protein [Thermoguttaceae bacterium]